MIPWSLVLLTRTFSCILYPRGLRATCHLPSISGLLPTPLHVSAELGQSQPEPWVFNRPCPPGPVKRTKERMSKGEACPLPSGRPQVGGGGAFLTPGDPRLREETHIGSQEPPTWREIQRSALRSPQPAGRGSPAFKNMQSEGGVLVPSGVRSPQGDTGHC